MVDRYFRSEMDALMYSVHEGVPMDVRYAGDGYWVTRQPNTQEPDLIVDASQRTAKAFEERILMEREPSDG